MGGAPNVGGVFTLSASGDVVSSSPDSEIPNSAGQREATRDTRDDAFLPFYFSQIVVTQTQIV